MLIFCKCKLQSLLFIGFLQSDKHFFLHLSVRNVTELLITPIPVTPFTLKYHSLSLFFYPYNMSCISVLLLYKLFVTSVICISWNRQETLIYRFKVSSNRPAPWSCGLMHHVLVWEVGGSTLGDYFFYSFQIMHQVFRNIEVI